MSAIFSITSVDSIVNTIQQFKGIVPIVLYKWDNEHSELDVSGEGIVVVIDDRNNNPETAISFMNIEFNFGSFNEIGLIDIYKIEDNNKIKIQTFTSKENYVEKIKELIQKYLTS
jgi:hypothetical protein